MSLENHLKHITIVGASGQLGSQLVDHLLHANRFTITALSRDNSDATFPTPVHVLKGDYDSREFLESSLKGQDVLIIAFGFDVPLDLEARIIDAAGKAGVPWIIPNEWSGDGTNEELCEVFRLLGEKMKYRVQIEQLENNCAWIGVANNPWFDYSLKSGWFGIEILKRKAMIFDDGQNAITTTTIAQVCRAVAALLSLPVHSSSGSACISDYKNRFVYLESFSINQQDMLAAVQSATGTSPEDWQLEWKAVDEYIDEGRKEDEKGEELGVVKILYGCMFKDGLGDKFYGREIANERLGLPKESLDVVVDRVVIELEEEANE